MSVELRDTTASDAPAIKELLEEHAVASFGEPELSEDEIRSWFEMPRLWIQLAQRDGEPVGYLDVGREDDGTHFNVDARTLDAEVASVMAADPDVVFVCSPNNPTGNAQPLSAIVGIAQGLPNALVIVDEAYGEFAPAASAQALIATNPNIAITRTFSKAFALAGARIGYLLAAPAVVADLQRVRLPYHLSALTQTAGIVALRHREEASALLGAIRVQRDRISRELRTLPRVTVYPSDANFVLFVPPVDAVLVWQGLLDRGVLVRDLSAVVPNALRVTAGTEHEVDRFLTAIKEVLAA